MFFKSLTLNIMLISLVFLGIGFTWMHLMSPLEQTRIEKQADFYATQVTITHTNHDGELYSQLQTPLATHYPTYGDIVFSMPVFTLYLKENEIWQLTSRYGKLDENKDLLQLWNTVQLQQRKTTSILPVSKLTTDTLDIHLDNQTAYTSDPVVITQSNQMLHAIGLYADFKTKMLKLLSQVKGQFMPIKPSRLNREQV